MLWVYGHYKSLYPYRAGTDFRRHILTSTEIVGSLSQRRQGYKQVFTALVGFAWQYLYKHIVNVEDGHGLYLII